MRYHLLPCIRVSAFTTRLWLVVHHPYHFARCQKDTSRRHMWLVLHGALRWFSLEMLWSSFYARGKPAPDEEGRLGTRQGFMGSSVSFLPDFLSSSCHWMGSIACGYESLYNVATVHVVFLALLHYRGNPLSQGVNGVWEWRGVCSFQQRKNELVECDFGRKIADVTHSPCDWNCGLICSSVMHALVRSGFCWLTWQQTGQRLHPSWSIKEN